MNFMTDTKELILALKKVRAERGLNVDQITEIVEAADKKNAPSRSSIARVFAEGSEDDSSHFRFEATLKPICNALLDIETDEKEDSAEDLAFKSLIRYKKDLLDDYASQIRDLKEELKTIKEKEHKKYDEKIKKETEQFHKSIDFAKRQIDLKDHRIDQLLNANDRLQNSNDKLMDINNKLIMQLTECPLKKKEGD